MVVHLHNSAILGGEKANMSFKLKFFLEMIPLLFPCNPQKDKKHMSCACLWGLF